MPSCRMQIQNVSDALIGTLLGIHVQTAHKETAASTANSVPTAKLEHIKRPTISRGGTLEDWAYFKTRWEEYAAATKVFGRDSTLQLLECCEEDLRKDLTRNAGGSLSTKSEDTVLTAIKELAIREENSLIARMELFNMRQNNNEDVRSYCARLKGQADTCKYSVKCTKRSCDQMVDYRDEMLIDALIRGIADNNIRLDILQKEKQDLSLEEIVKFIETREKGKQSAAQLDPLASVDGAKSQYRRNKLTTKPKDITNKTNRNANCSYCN